MDVSAIRPGGYLLQLPREVRDQIYGDYFNGTYPVCWSYHISEDDVSQGDSPQDDESQNDDPPDDRPQDEDSQASLQHTPTDLAILQTSKVLHNDVKGFLLSKAASKAGTYKYVIDLDPRENFSNPPFKEATDHMTNVMFEVRVHPERTTARAEADGYEIKTISGVSFMNSIWVCLTSKALHFAPMKLTRLPRTSLPSWSFNRGITTREDFARRL